MKIIKTSEETTQIIDELEQVEQSLRQAEQKLIKQVEAELEDIECRYGVGIGIRLDVQRIGQIIAYMIANRQDAVTLKYEVWK